jgi:hypothetical protein
MNLSEHFPNPKDEAKKSAKLIGLGVLTLICSLAFLFFFLGIFKGPWLLSLIIIVISGTAEFSAAFLMLVGTIFGFHAIYRLIKLRESWGFAWVSIIALPLILLLILILLAGITYKGP